MINQMAILKFSVNSQKKICFEIIAIKLKFVKGSL